MIDKFRAKFVEEALDNVQDLEEALLLLDRERDDSDHIERIFRAMHSLKGGGAMFGFTDLSEFTHHLETLFDLIRNREFDVTDEIISLTFECIDQIKHYLEVGDLSDESDKNTAKALVVRLNDIIDSNTANTSAVSEDDSTDRGDNGNELPVKTYFIHFAPQMDILQNGTNPLFLLDDLSALGKTHVFTDTKNLPTFDKCNLTNCYVSWTVLLSTSEDISEIQDVFIFVEDECTLEITEIANFDIIGTKQLGDVVEKFKQSDKELSLDLIKKVDWDNSLNDSAVSTSQRDKKEAKIRDHKISSIRVASTKIDELVNLVSELVTIQAQFSLYASNNGDPYAISLSENIQKLTKLLRDNAFEISLIPLQNEIMRFQRLVHDLSKDLGKKIDFVVEGGDIELDKNIIYHLTDPLLHMIRNSIDHGIEMPDEREINGKPKVGTIKLQAYHQGANVVIKLSDDGAGIDHKRIQEKAISKGIIAKDKELQKSEIYDLMFLSGLSTRENVSDLSGRGVGMDVVKRKINEIRGRVSIDSELGKGTTITLELPLTLSIIDGLLVKVADKQYVLPISSVEKLFLLEDEDKDKIYNQVISIGDEQFPIINLQDIFNTHKTLDSQHIVQVKYHDQKIGLIVDEVVGEYQTVVKPLGKLLHGHDVISGASIMGDGNISMVVDVNRLISKYWADTIKSM